MFDKPEINDPNCHGAVRPRSVAPLRPDLARSGYLSSRRSLLDREDAARRAALPRKIRAAVSDWAGRMIRTTLRRMRAKAPARE